MTSLQAPKLRQHGLQAAVGTDPETVVLSDQFRLGSPLLLSRAAFDVIRLFDGQKTLQVIQAESAVMFEGQPVALEILNNLVAGLEQEYYLESPRLFSRLSVADRPPSCIGCYDADP